MLFSDMWLVTLASMLDASQDNRGWLPLVIALVPLEMFPMEISNGALYRGENAWRGAWRQSGLMLLRATYAGCPWSLPFSAP